MRYCPNCDNFLMPKNNTLYCKACNQTFKLEINDYNEYKPIKTMRHDEKGINPIIIKEGLKNKRISNEKKKAYGFTLVL